MADEQWLLKEDGYLNIDEKIKHIVYHPNLNVILVFTHGNLIKVLDVNSGVVLQTCPLKGDAQRNVCGRYLPEQDKILLWDGQTIGMRGDYNGVLLLDTILQVPVIQGEDMIKLDLLLSEALLFKESMQVLHDDKTMPGHIEVKAELLAKIDAAQAVAKSGIKAQKWITVCLEVTHSSMKMTASNIVYHLKCMERHIPELSVASAINERLTDMLVDSRIQETLTVGNMTRFLMHSEVSRRQTFEQWPHMDYKWALPDLMAQAGFFHQPTVNGEDRAMCFTCSVCLVSWEKTDEPWSEHERHSPTCPFVKGEYTQNVPLSITYATNPAIKANEFTLTSNGDHGNLLCTGNALGEVAIWNTERQLTKMHTMHLRNDDKILPPLLHGVWNGSLTALATLDRPLIGKYRNNQNDTSLSAKNSSLCFSLKQRMFGSRVICGITCDNTSTDLMLLVYVIKDTPTVDENTMMETDKLNADIEVMLVEQDSAAVEAIVSELKPSEAASQATKITEDVYEGMKEYSKQIISDIMYQQSLPAEKYSYKLFPISDTDNLKMDALEFKIQSFDEMVADYQDNLGMCDEPETLVPEFKENPGKSNEPISCELFQCVPLSAKLPNSAHITDIIPSYNNKRLLIVVRGQKSAEIAKEAEDTRMDVDGEESTATSTIYTSGLWSKLMCLTIGDDGYLSENAVSVMLASERTAPVQICMLPDCDNNGRQLGGPATSDGVFAMVTASGSLKLVSLNKMTVMAEATHSSGSFIAVEYCKSLERLCACTADGALHFYSFYDMEADSGDEREDDNICFGLSEDSSTNCEQLNITNAAIRNKNNQAYAMNPSMPFPSTDNTSSTGVQVPILAFKLAFETADLQELHSLTLFDEMLTPYSAEVPPCWNELVTTQVQRKATPASKPGDDIHLTKTWRLHNDATTWDEHLIEITLPKITSLGHIDLKFSLYQCTTPPAIQVTLLKQNTNGFGYRMKTPAQRNELDFFVDDNVDFNLSTNRNNNKHVSNPVLSEEYLQARNAEIVAGPIDLASCLDMSDHCGVVSLTSPKLFRAKTKNYLLHIKTMIDPAHDGQNRIRMPAKKDESVRYMFPTYVKHQLLNQSANSPRITNGYIGCDWLHEISITVRRSKHIAMPGNSERIQRNAMLDSNQLLNKLLEIAINPSSKKKDQNLALDILLWIVTIRMKRYRQPQCSVNTNRGAATGNNKGNDQNDMYDQQVECSRVVEKNLVELMKHCLINANRSIAHKTVKLIVLTFGGVQNLPKEQLKRSTFESTLTQSVLLCLSLFGNAKCASSLRWFSTLVCGTTTSTSQGFIAEACVRLLLESSVEYIKRDNAYSPILRARFDLNTMPFEPEIFDYDFFVPSSITLKTNPQAFTTHDGKKVITDRKGYAYLAQMMQRDVSNHLRGILEVQQLHYICCAASEATRIEQMDASTTASQSTTNFPEDIVFDTTTLNNVDLTPPPTMNGVLNETKMTAKKSMDKLKNLKSDIMLFNNAKNLMANKYYIFKGTDGNQTIMQKNEMTDDFYVPQQSPLMFSETTNSQLITESESSNGFIDLTMDDGSQDEDDITAKSSPLMNKMDNYDDGCPSDGLMPWYKLLSVPPKQMIVVDRMQSGCKRYVVLDFGAPILLTDVIVPGCEELVSLVIDIWNIDEQTDSIRLCSSTDLATKNLVITDLQPPPICRYLKMTATGKYGMSATRCKIPIGSFFGHLLLLENDGSLLPSHFGNLVFKCNDLPKQISALQSFHEDVQCRYNLACSKLMDLLNPLLHSDLSNVAHMQAFRAKQKDNDNNNSENAHIIRSYEECIALQTQLNTIKHVLERLETPLKPIEVPNFEPVHISELPKDKIRVMNEVLVEITMHFLVKYGSKNVNAVCKQFNRKACNALFSSLIIGSELHMQYAIGSLLLKMCSSQRWWGDFLVEHFMKLYSSQNCELFSQERVFNTFTFLGRKSISNSRCRAVLIDSVLKSLAKLLNPISLNILADGSVTGNVWVKTDIQLISWILLFLSVCIDDPLSRKEQAPVRWDFMSEEPEVMKGRLPTNNYKTLARSLKKRFAQSKQQTISTEKIVSSLPKTLSHYNALVAKKAHGAHLDSFGSGIVFKTKMEPSTSAAGASSSNQQQTPLPQPKAQAPPPPPPTTSVTTINPFDAGLRMLNPGNTLIVIKGLFGLILSMDFTCHMDLFLLSCKIIARLVSASRPPWQLSSILTPGQLQQLIKMAVWTDQQQPWTVHAITCLLQDILEADRNYRISNTGETLITDAMEGVTECDEPNIVDAEIDRANMMKMAKDMCYSMNYKYSLPSLMEIDDAEFDSFSNDMLNHSSPRIDAPAPPRNVIHMPNQIVSSALDARLECGLDTSIEIKLRRIVSKCALSSLSRLARMPHLPFIENFGNSIPIEPWPESITAQWANTDNNSGGSSYKILMKVFGNIFIDLHVQNSWLNMEQVLQMWLTLNSEISEKSSKSGFNPADVPKIAFSPAAVVGLLNALSWHQGIALRSWCLGFQCLIWACNPHYVVQQPSAGCSETSSGNIEMDGGFPACGIGVLIVDNPNFEKMLCRFFSSIYSSVAEDTNRFAGETLCKLLHELCLWIEIKSDIKDKNYIKTKLKEILMRVLLSLVQPSGAISQQKGPIDAQQQLIKELLNSQYEKTDLRVAMSIIESVSYLVHNQTINSDKIYCQRTLDTKMSSDSFGSLFASVLGSESIRNWKGHFQKESPILVSLLKLSSLMVQTPLTTRVVVEPMSTGNVPGPSSESQTDEIKAEQQHNENFQQKTPTFADAILQHCPTMSRLLGALSQCTTSSFALLAASTLFSGNGNDASNSLPLNEPHTIADAVFELLAILCKKATKPQLIVKPLYDFLNQVSANHNALPRLQLSEPFIWFILRVLDTTATVSIFAEMGGIKVLCQNLVRSNRSLINMQPGLVSTMMQYTSKLKGRASNMFSNNVKKYQSTQSMPQPVPCGVHKATTSTMPDDVINFAPFSTITSETSTVHSADILIQMPVSSHRRGRTPAWSYQYYPGETYVDLTINLPTAILLKEIQIQPHLPSLASSPSAVAIEIIKDASLGPVPISQPISTVGLTCIRLKLDPAEIATSVVLRLYRPRDSATIGLTQVSVLGSTSFSDVAGKTDASTFKNTSNTSGEICEDESTAKSSLGWLRILARCFSVAAYVRNGELSKCVIASSVDYPGFLEACCSLLNIVAISPSQALQNVETVLCQLGLHNRELGLRLIDILLTNTTPQTFRMCNDAVSDLLYDLCCTEDEWTRDRIASVMYWVQGLYAASQQEDSYIQMTNPFSGIIKCLSSILWTVHGTNFIPDLSNMITKEFFESIFQWTMTLRDNELLKNSIDSMLCAICCIRPEMFPLLLQKMGVLVPNLSTDIGASISDDRKDADGLMNEDQTQVGDTEEWYSHLVIEDLSCLFLMKHELTTIAVACQSPLAVHQLLDSGLPRLLAFAVLEYCSQMSPTPITDEPESNDFESSLTDSDKAENTHQRESTTPPKRQRNAEYPLVNTRSISCILDFFSDICSEAHMRDWFGSYEGSMFWKPLLHLLCNNRPIHDNDSQTYYSHLETATIRFLSRVSSSHPKNQEHLSLNLIAVIKKPSRVPANSFGSGKHIISGFTRRLILQLLLESETVTVYIKSDLPLLKKDRNFSAIRRHPSKRPNTFNLLLELSTQTKCQEILDQYVSPYLSGVLPTPMDGRNGILKFFESSSNSTCSQSYLKIAKTMAKHLNMTFTDSLAGESNSVLDSLSVAAGVTAKDKRSKDAKNQATLKIRSGFPQAKNKTDEIPPLAPVNSINAILRHGLCPEFNITGDTTISQILAMLHNSGYLQSSSCLSLNLTQSGSISNNEITDEPKASDIEPLPSPLQIFSSRGGLSLLAHYLPTVYPDASKTQIQTNVQSEKEKSTPEWVKVDETYDDLEETLVETSLKPPIVTSVPQHSLAAFGLFLKLPSYSEVLLKDRVKAQCLLRLVLGVTGDGEGNEIFTLPLSSSLPTLPFEVLRQLLDGSPLTTDDGVLLRRMVIEVGAMHLVLNCLGIFTHHSQSYQIHGPVSENVQSTAKSSGSGSNDETVQKPLDDKAHMYWAKGTGFGTGSTQQSWDVEQALMRQKSEEEYVTVLFQVLASYISPGDNMTEVLPELPPIFLDLLSQSCLISALSSYLRNDSVLDITRHIPLYRAVLLLLRAIALSNQLVSLLLPQNNDGTMSIAVLLLNMKTCVDTYASRLKVNKKSSLKGQTQKVTFNLDDNDDEGLAMLIPDIQDTTLLVQRASNVDSLHSQLEAERSRAKLLPASKTLEERYLDIMKELQFDTFEMIADADVGYRFSVSYHFESNVRMAGDHGHPARMKRLAQETVTLSTSLPLSYSSSVFVRCDTDRLDIMKVLITGPADTPYANGCFEFDVYFPPEYPNAPMMINLETTGRHTVRFNPNLYNDGKVCLSVLNTWHGRPEEKWNSQTSSFLQVLVSIQSLILVPEPYFNEPGFERSRGSPNGTHSSKEYNSNIYQACVRWAMLEQIRNPNPCFKDVILTHFWLKRHEICNQIEGWMAELNKPQYSERNGRSITFNAMVLRRQYRQLREEFAKLPTPTGLEDLEQIPFSASSGSPTVMDASTSTTITSATISTEQTDVNNGSSSDLPVADDGMSSSSVMFDSSSSDSNTPNMQTDSIDSTNVILSFSDKKLN